MLDSQGSSRRISSSTRRVRGDMGIGPYPQLDRLLKSGGIGSEANNQNPTSELSSEVVTTKRYIWGTTLVVAEASKMFEDFLLNFTMADRIRAMREEDPTISIEIKPEHEQPFYFPRILKEVNIYILIYINYHLYIYIFILYYLLYILIYVSFLTFIIYNNCNKNYTIFVKFFFHTNFR